MEHVCWFRRLGKRVGGIVQHAMAANGDVHLMSDGRGEAGSNPSVSDRGVEFIRLQPRGLVAYSVRSSDDPANTPRPVSPTEPQRSGQAGQSAVDAHEEWVQRVVRDGQRRRDPRRRHRRRISRRDVHSRFADVLGATEPWSVSHEESRDGTIGEEEPRGVNEPRSVILRPAGLNDGEEEENPYAHAYDFD